MYWKKLWLSLLINKGEGVTETQWSWKMRNIVSHKTLTCSVSCENFYLSPYSAQM
jgi:hypothetical protein